MPRPWLCSDVAPAFVMMVKRIEYSVVFSSQRKLWVALFS